MRALLEPVELQIDVDGLAVTTVELPEGADERLVARQSDAVGVEVDVADRLALRHVDHGEDVLVNRGLTTGEHDDLRLALRRDVDVEHALALLERDGVAVGLVAGVSEADRAVQVAVGVDLDDPQARVLLVLGAQPAVRRAAVLDLGLELQRDRARLVEPRRIDIHLRVAVDERLELAMFSAAFPQEYLVVVDVDLGVDDDLADRADRPVNSTNTSSRSRFTAGTSAGPL